MLSLTHDESLGNRHRKAQDLFEDKQAYAAEVIEYIAASDKGAFQIPDDHREAVLEGLAQADRGELASEEEMAALWKSRGL